MVKSKETAKKKYLDKTTKSRFKDGVEESAAKSHFKDRTGEFFGVTVSDKVATRWQDNTKAGSDDFEKRTDGDAFDKLYKKAGKGLSE